MLHITEWSVHWISWYSNSGVINTNNTFSLVMRSEGENELEHRGTGLVCTTENTLPLFAIRPLSSTLVLLKCQWGVIFFRLKRCALILRPSSPRWVIISCSRVTTLTGSVWLAYSSLSLAPTLPSPSTERWQWGEREPTIWIDLRSHRNVPLRGHRGWGKMYTAESMGKY